MIYLFIGADPASKDIRLAKLKEELSLGRRTCFNYDLLYAQELTLKSFQEKCACLAVGVQQRLILVRDALTLRQEIKDYLLQYARKPFKGLVLVLDVVEESPKI